MLKLITTGVDGKMRNLNLMKVCSRQAAWSGKPRKIRLCKHILIKLLLSFLYLDGIVLRDYRCSGAALLLVWSYFLTRKYFRYWRPSKDYTTISVRQELSILSMQFTSYTSNSLFVFSILYTREFIITKCARTHTHTIIPTIFEANSLLLFL